MPAAALVAAALYYPVAWIFYRLPRDMFTIVQLSDLHCGQQFFLPQQLERAIAEVNELEPDVVVISGDLTSHGFKDEYALAREYLDGDRVRVDGRDPRQPRLAQRRLRPLRGAVRRAQLGAATSAAATIVAVDSTEPDLDNGQIGRGRYRLDRGAVRGAGRPARLRPAPPPAADPGNRPRAQHRQRRRRRDRVPAARRASTSSSPATSTSRTRGGSRTSSSSTRARSRPRGCAGNGRPCYNVVEVEGTHVDVWRQYPFHDAGADHPVLDRHEDVREVHGADRGRGALDVSERALALIDGEHYRAGRARGARGAAVRLRRRAARRRDGEAARRRRLRRPARRRRSTRSRWTSSSTSPTSRCSGRASGCSGRRGRSRSGCRTSAPTSASTRRRSSRSATPSLAVIGTGKRVGKTAVAGARRARARARPPRRRRRDGPRRAGGAGARRDAADARRALALSRAGRHAASDHLETAALAGVPTIGCRRAGGGLAGAPFLSNVLEGARLAAQLEPELVVFDGSGAAIPPVEVDARILVTNGGHDPRAGLNAYRVLVSDLVVDTGGADRRGDPRDLRRRGGRGELRLRPAEPLARPPHRRLHDRALRRPTTSTPRSSTSRATSRGATRCGRSSSASTRRCISSS